MRVWPVLLGVNHDDIDPVEYDGLVRATHRDSSVVDVDVVRSLWAYTPDWSDEARDAKRDELRRLLTATVCSNHDVYYYQGLHDIASVLLFVLGEPLAFVCLRRMVQVHLRDCTRYDCSVAACRKQFWTHWVLLCGTCSITHVVLLGYLYLLLCMYPAVYMTSVNITQANHGPRAGAAFAAARCAARV